MEQPKIITIDYAALSEVVVTLKYGGKTYRGILDEVEE